MQFRKIILPTTLFAAIVGVSMVASANPFENAESVYRSVVENPPDGVSQGLVDSARNTMNTDFSTAQDRLQTLITPIVVEDTVSAEGTAPPVVAAADTATEDAARATSAADTQRLAGLEQQADDARAREASLANRALTGVTMGAMGVGLAQAGQGMAERRADDRWAAEIAALTDSFRCGISGQGHNIRHNETGTVPRESTRFREIRLEYLGNDVEEGLAQRVRRLKERLGMPPGIESEAILDTRGLYTADARMDQGFTGGFTTAQDRADAGDGARRAQTGAIVAGAGLAVGVVGNWAFNNKWPQLGSGQRNAASDPWVAGFQNDSRNANLIQQAGGMPAILQAANAGNRDMNRMNDAQRTEFITEFVQNQPNQ